MTALRFMLVEVSKLIPEIITLWVLRVSPDLIMLFLLDKFNWVLLTSNFLQQRKIFNQCIGRICSYFWFSVCNRSYRRYTYSHQSPIFEWKRVFNRKKNYHLINVMTMCDSNLTFINLVAKWPGSSHDAFVWSNSALCEMFESGNTASCWYSVTVPTL